MLISVFFFFQKSSLKIRYFIAIEFIINYDRIVLRYNLVLIFTAWVYSIVKTQPNRNLILFWARVLRKFLTNYFDYLLYLMQKTMYLLTEWEGRTGKYLGRGHGVRTERSEDRAPWPWAKYFPVRPDLTQSISILLYDHHAFPFSLFFFFFFFFFFFG